MAAAVSSSQSSRQPYAQATQRGDTPVAMAPSETHDRPSYLRVLSTAQYNAVTAPPQEPLQILAGPGSGKTRVLVARVAWLILEHNVDPRDLVVVTFTNKAANEMRHRLNILIGQHRTSLLVLGTFHATCARYLRQYASLVDLSNNFSICDADQAKSAIKAILKSEGIKNKIPEGLKPELFLSEISRAKAKNFDTEGFDAWLTEIEAGRQSSKSMGGRGRPESTSIRRAVSLVYKAYTDHLRKNNALDFDDLLVFGLRLFRENARVTANIHHVLVDEFQDTNTVQYALMVALSGRGGSRGAVSIVGDPDQSIYGWRSAEVGNLRKMAEEFASWSSASSVCRVFLEENYRSTGHILQTAKAIIDCDSNRIERGLYTSHAVGPPPMCKQFANSQNEALFVATEIKRLIAATGGMLQLDDFAILLRFNALSREVEQQLQAENIPSRMMGGARFFERKEVKDILAYLTLAGNPRFTPAMERVINVPKRSIGEKSVQEILALASTEGVRAMEIVERVATAKKPIMGFRPAIQASLRGFVDIIKELRSMALKHMPVADIIEHAIKRTDYEAYLRKEADFDQRWENVKELINFGTAITAAPSMSESEQAIDSPEAPISSGVFNPSTQATEVVSLLSSDEEDEGSPTRTRRSKDSPPLSHEDGCFSKLASSSTTSPPQPSIALFDGNDDVDAKTPLGRFLEAATLSTDMAQDDEDGKKPKVTIATTHAAKGLEFPVVFVLSVEEGTYPFYRASNTTEEVDEEARLLYVGVTRAQAVLYLTHCQARLVNGQMMDKSLSRFVSPTADPSVVVGGAWGKGTQIGYDGQTPAPTKRDRVPYIKTRPVIGAEERRAISTVLNRPAPSDQQVQAMLSAFENSDVGVRARRADQEPSSSSLPSYTFYNPHSTLFSRPQPGQVPAGGGAGSLFGASKAHSHIAPATSVIGFSTASAALRSKQSAPNGAYDAEGWAVETRAGAASGVAAASAGSGRHTHFVKQSPKSSASTFMDPYRASKGGVAHNGVIGAASAHALHERPTADAARFKAKNDSSISDILALLPDSHSRPNGTSQKEGSRNGSTHRLDAPSLRTPNADQARHNGYTLGTHVPLAGASSTKRRLGMGRPQVQLPPKKEARREQ